MIKMVKILTVAAAVVCGLLLFAATAPVVMADDSTETLTFAWDQDSVENLKQWEMHWGATPGGSYSKLTDITYAGGTGPTFESPVEAVVTGQPGTHETRYFVLRACGDLPQDDGSTAYECSDFSNEVSYGFWIPAKGFSIPMTFRITTQQ